MKRKHKRSFEFFSTFSYFTPGWMEILSLMLWFLIGALLGSLLSSVALLVGGESYTEYALLIAYPIQFIPAMMYAASRSRANAFFSKGYALDSKHFGNIGPALCCVLVMAATFAAIFVTDLFSSFLPQIPEKLKAILEKMTQGELWVNFLSVSVMAPFFEEWLCRGMIERGLLQRMKPVWAIVISAFIFALIHMNPWQALPAFLVGCLLGYVYYKTGSLKLTMLMHFTNNTFALLMSRVDAFKDVDNMKDFLPSNQYWLIFAACSLLLVLIIRKFSSIELQSEKGNCDEINPDVEIS